MQANLVLLILQEQPMIMMFTQPRDAIDWTICFTHSVTTPQKADLFPLYRYIHGAQAEVYCHEY